MTTAHTLTTKKFYAHNSGILALKPERLARVIELGGDVLNFGDRMPEDGILLVDCRPKDFVGGRTANDPADTAIFIGNGPLNGTYITRRKNFEHALNKAVALTKSGAA